MSGTSIGVPSSSTDTGALTAANNVAGAEQVAASAPAAAANSDQPSIIIVEVIGYGGGGESEEQRGQKSEKRSEIQDPHSRYQVIGAGNITDERALELADERRSLIGR